MKALLKSTTLAFLLSMALPLLSFAAPKDIQNYKIIDGGFSDIAPGAIVEGSTSFGGLQPDYKIDLDKEPLKTLLLNATRIGQANITYWDKVGAVLALIQKDFFLHYDYEHPAYRELMEKYRVSNDDVPLSEYGVCQAGVCREHALVLHFALKAAGIANQHVYAEIHRSVRGHYDITEDHAFNVVEYKGEKWVVDAYYWGFNGFRLRDLSSALGVTEFSTRAPIADSQQRAQRRIVHINSFPRIYNPLLEIKSCSGLFL